MAGQVDLSVSGATLTVTMNMMVQGNNANRVCKVEAYQMIVTDHGAHAEVNISGRFYDPDYGYIDLQTTSNFMINTSDEYPYSGQMVLTGETGTAGGPTSAMLTAHDSTTCARCRQIPMATGITMTLMITIAESSYGLIYIMHE